ncbi:uncharacterized protein A4U43_C04F2400 [Asparagus officinalis]|uniref:Uncharacterized protein n=1 Tax=Asparagus officinalis TaxID=4686 RepID=A0A5P1EY63_ASPOF|nr:uncharacterized protein A4U43_C04F2400 [Asparagus officinalis]
MIPKSTEKRSYSDNSKLVAKLESINLYVHQKMAGVGRNVAAPLLFLNLVMYLIVIGFASWCLNHFINGQTDHPGLAGNGATFYFLVFSILAGVIGVTSKLSGAYHSGVGHNGISLRGGLQRDTLGRLQRMEAEGIGSLHNNPNLHSALVCYAAPRRHVQHKVRARAQGPGVRRTRHWRGGPQGHSQGLVFLDDDDDDDIECV